MDWFAIFPDWVKPILAPEQIQAICALLTFFLTIYLAWTNKDLKQQNEILKEQTDVLKSQATSLRKQTKILQNRRKEEIMPHFNIVGYPNDSRNVHKLILMSKVSTADIVLESDSRKDVKIELNKDYSLKKKHLENPENYNNFKNYQFPEFLEVVISSEVEIMNIEDAISYDLLFWNRERSERYKQHFEFINGWKTSSPKPIS